MCSILFRKCNNSSILTPEITKIIYIRNYILNTVMLQCVTLYYLINIGQAGKIMKKFESKIKKKGLIKRLRKKIKIGERSLIFFIYYLPIKIH